MNDYLIDKKDVKPYKAVICYVLAVIFIVADQLTKYLIVKNFELNGHKEIIKDFFSLYYVRNTGSAFSMFADKTWGIYMLSAVSLLMSIVIIYAIYKTLRHKSFWLKTSLVLLLAGAIGNLIDRIRIKYVVDFLRFDFGSYTFPIFNFADICAVCGTAILLLMIIISNKSVDAYLQLFELKGKKDNASKD